MIRKPNVRVKNRFKKYKIGLSCAKWKYPKDQFIYPILLVKIYPYQKDCIQMEIRILLCYWNSDKSSQKKNATFWRTIPIVYYRQKEGYHNDLTANILQSNCDKVQINRFKGVWDTKSIDLFRVDSLSFSESPGSVKQANTFLQDSRNTLSNV